MIPSTLRTLQNFENPSPLQASPTVLSPVASFRDWSSVFNGGYDYTVAPSKGQVGEY